MGMLQESVVVMPELFHGAVMEMVFLIATACPGLLFMDRCLFAVDIMMFGDLSQRCLMQSLLLIMLLSPCHILRLRPGCRVLVIAGTGLFCVIGELI
ncbi:hypothetical protein SYNGFB01_04250 [Synechococcus sp. GFB01]|nr:hypothetical protein SYNGFB01_09645 [Synechococcus sp. GFB01]KMM17400.1 hypothetical protein SYNGFB01_04250 [Synechococcus sp. GFB01]